MLPSDPTRVELYERARRLRWTLAGGALAAFGAIVGLVLTNPIGTQAQAAQPSGANPASDAQQPEQPQYQQPQYQQPQVSNAGQQQPILRTRRS